MTPLLEMERLFAGGEQYLVASHASCQRMARLEDYELVDGACLRAFLNDVLRDATGLRTLTRLYERYLGPVGRWMSREDITLVLYERLTSPRSSARPFIVLRRIVARPFDHAPPRKEEPRPPGPMLPDVHGFQVRFVDEVGEDLAGLALRFEHGGRSEAQSTDSSGVAQIFGSIASVATVTVADEAALAAVLERRWSEPRNDRRWLESQDAQIITCCGDKLPGVYLRPETVRLVSVQPAVACTRLLGGFFDSAKCFLLPEGLAGVRSVVSRYKQYRMAKLLIVGHTDADGTSAYNDGLSLERAESLKQYLTGDVDSWLRWYGGDVAEKKRWGSVEDLAMLDALPDAASRATNETLVRWFQRTRGLTLDGRAGPQTRAVLVEEYMALDGTSLPAGIEVTTHGCGEHFPQKVTADGAVEAENRRVEVFYFEGPLGILPPPAGKNSGPGTLEYPEWVRKARQWHDHRIPPVGTFTSRLAVDELAGTAKDIGEYGFVSWMNRVFGDDVPMEAYRKLYVDLVQGSVASLPILLQPGGREGHLAAYDRECGLMVIDAALVAEAAAVPERAFVLACALVEEFGHHVDHLLRNVYSRRGHDALLDEGARFGYALLSPFCRAEPQQVHVGTYAVGDASQALFVDLSDFGEIIDNVLGEWEQRHDERTDHYEYFGAGRGKGHAGAGHSFGHQSIEDALNEVPGFRSEEVRLEVYYGNWLRDYSQAIVPTLLRDPTAPDAPGFTREALTKVVDVMARQHFANTPQFSVDVGKLGVYRTEEHIDNPFGLADGRSKDLALDAAPSAKQLDVNPGTWLKYHIDTDCSESGVKRPSALDFSSGALRRALAAGFTPLGRMHFGAALHTLEDFYSHSNFLELALIQVGFDRVWPWTAPVALPPMRPIFPVVTGCFGSVDTAASLAYEISETMAKASECTPGKRSPGADIALILLADKKPEWHARAEAALSEYEHFQRANPTVFRAYCRATDWLFGWIDHAIGEALHAGASAMDDAQTEYAQNVATSTHPTHTQLAKDHDDHPLHELAATCAKRAVTSVARAAMAAWQGHSSHQSAVATLQKFFVHPAKIVASEVELALILSDVREWGVLPSNRDKLERTYSTTIRQHLMSSSEWAEARETARALIQRGRQMRDAVENETAPQTIDRRQRELRELYKSLSPP